MADRPRLAGLTLDDAMAIARAVLAVGHERGFAPLAAAVVDPLGETQALQRADGAHPLTSRIAVAKARTALVTLLPSGAAAELPEGIRAAALALYHGDFVARAGGLLVARDGILVGAVGASGAASEEDEEAVRVAIERWTAR